MTNTPFSPTNYRAAPDLLKNKVILVSGAGDGIGRAAAESYAAHGATVILLGRTQEKLEAVYDAIEAAGHPQAAVAPMDLASASEGQCEELAGMISDSFGRLDGLLNNASILGERRPIENTTYKAWQEVMQINVNGQFLLTRYMLPLLQTAPSASIVFTSSGVGRRGRAYWGAYATAKFATEGLMQVLAAELENTSQVRCNSLNPGATNTAMRRSAYPAEHPDTNPIPADIMPAYLYLMGNDSKNVHGQALNAQQAN
ncbi:MAG: YciK family oxidoreductase [Parahaliea sp.]